MLLLPSIEVISRVLLDATAKGTVLMLVAWIAVRLLHRSSAAVRHRVWSLAMISLLLLPALSSLLPAWQLPIPSDFIDKGVLQTNVVINVPPEAGPAQSSAAGNVSPQWIPVSSEGNGSLAFGVGAHPHPTVGTSVRWDVVLGVGAWCLGLIVCSTGIVVGQWRTWQLSRASRIVGDERWGRLLQTLREHLRLRCNIELREYSEAIVPLTFGLWRPQVMLPQQAHSWSEPLRRTVLLHELVHIKRGDVAYQLLGRIACALYWFHPLVWLAQSQLRQEREQACDDAVVSTGEQATDYAQQLLEVARQYHLPRGLSLAVEMASSGSLELRLQSLFDSHRSHRPLSRVRAAALLTLTSLFLCGVAVVQPVARPRVAAAEELNDKKVTAPPPPKTAAETDAKSKATIPVGIVIAKHVMLWEGREIVTWEQIADKMAAYPDPALLNPQFCYTPTALSKRATNPQIFKLKERFKFYGFSIGSVSPRSAPRYDRIQTADDLKVNKANEITGRVLAPDGKPVANAEVLLITPIDDSVSYKSYNMSLTQGVVDRPLDHVMTRTDSNGQFHFYPDGGWTYALMAVHPEFGFRLIYQKWFLEKHVVDLRAWACLECELKTVGAEKQFITLDTRIPEFPGLPDLSLGLDSVASRATKPGDKFHFRHVPAGYTTNIMRSFEGEQGTSYNVLAARVELLPGATRQMGFGPISEQQRQQLDGIRERFKPRTP